MKEYTDEELRMGKLGLLEEVKRLREVHALLAPYYYEVKRLQKRNEWLEEVVGLLQEDGVDLSIDGYPLWHEDGYMYWREEE